MLSFMGTFGDLSENVARIRLDIDRCLEKSGRCGESVKIVAVTKTFPAEAVKAAVRAGITDIGESRVQETADKKPSVGLDCRWHLIGHLQKNKVKKALELYDLIQSVDSYDLSLAIDQRATHPVEVLLQVDSSGERTKFGIDPDRIVEVARRTASLERVRVMGLMTIGPLATDETIVRHSFRLTKSLFDSLSEESIPNCEMRYLSMGMSSDYMIAVEEGSNMVRIGTAIFGSRG